MLVRHKERSICGNERGVALLVVLLVTALLIALIFEFAYATRISLNNAVNFRDSERAYFLAQSGINAFKSANGPQLRELIPPGEWYPVGQLLGESDTVIMVKWEDESGKIKINDVKTNKATEIVVNKLFENNGFDTAVLDRMLDPQASDIDNIYNLKLLSGLHRYMNDEDYGKVANSLTVAPVSQNQISININTASADVLKALGIDDMTVQRIMEERKDTPYTAQDLSSTGRLASLQNYPINNLNLFSYLKTQSAGFYKVYAYATVGGYTKQVEAILNGNAVYYWKAL